MKRLVEKDNEVEKHGLMVGVGREMWTKRAVTS
jgi:hypothetical protein